MKALIIGGPGDGKWLNADEYGEHLCLPYPPESKEALAYINVMLPQLSIRVAKYELKRIYFQLTPGQAQEYLFYCLPGTTSIDIMNALVHNYRKS